MNRTHRGVEKEDAALAAGPRRGQSVCFSAPIQNFRRAKLTLPKHLSPSSTAWYASVCDQYELEDHDLKLLELAAEALDEVTAANEIIRKNGLVVPTAGGGVKANPAVAIRRDARLAFARLVRELSLDADVMNESRPPSLRHNNGRTHRHA